MSAAVMTKQRWSLLAWDFVLCWVLTACFIQNASMTLLAEPQVVANPLWAILLPAVILALLELRALGSRCKVILPLAAVVVAALFAGIAMQSAPSGDILSDTADNPLPFVLLSIAASIGVYLLSRTCIGSVALAVLVILIVGAVEFLYEQGMASTATGVFLAALGLVILARFRKTSSNGSCGTCPPVHIALGTVALCAVAFLLAFGGYIALSSTVELPKAELKLITKEMALEEIEVEGITSTTLVYDDKRTSKEEQPSDWLSSLAGEQSSTDEQKIDESSDDGNMFNAISGVIDPEAWANALSTIRYNASLPIWLLVVVLIVVATILSILLKRASRKKRLERMLSLPAQEQACELFRSFMLQASKIGIKRREDSTLEEFCWESAPALERLFKSQPELMHSFKEGCDAFSQAYYGGKDPKPACLESLRELYEGFCPCALAYLGRLRYALKFFQL